MTWPLAFLTVGVFHGLLFYLCVMLYGWPGGKK